MRGIQLPGEDRLPVGPRRRFVVALHELYRVAGTPPLRDIERRIRDNNNYKATASRDTIAKMLNGDTVPNWLVAKCIIQQLATLGTPPRDPAAEAERFIKLWLAASSGADLEDDILSADTRSVATSAPAVDPHLSAQQITTLHELRSVPLLNARLTKLRDLFYRSPDLVVPWAGSGLGVHFGFPTWTVFLDRLAANVTLDESERQIAKALIDQERHDLAGDYLAQSLLEEYEKLIAQNFGNPPRPTHDSYLLSRLGIRKVVSTNLDRVLESNLVHFNAVTSDLLNAERTSNDYLILKLCGSVERRQTWGVDVVNWAWQLTDDMKNTLLRMFEQNVVLFLGCSLGRADISCQILRSMPRKSRGHHYALLAVSSDSEGRSRGQELEELGIEVIPYIPDREHSLLREVIDWMRAPLDIVASRIRDQIDRSPPELNPTGAELAEWDSVSEHLSVQEKSVLSACIVRWVERAQQERQEHAYFVESPELARLAERAADLSGSAAALSLAATMARAAGRSAERFEEALWRLSSQVQSRPRRRASRANPAIANLYSAHRRGDWVSMLHILESVKHRYPGYGIDRIEVLRLRAGLLAGGDTANRIWREFYERSSPRMKTFGTALVQINNWQFAAASDSLNELHRSLGSIKGHSYVLWMLATAMIGRTLPGLSSETLSENARHELLFGAQRNLIAAEKRMMTSVRTRRLFFSISEAKVPSELAYEPRAFDADETYVLMTVWSFLCGRRLSMGDSVPGEEILTELDRLNEEDLLLTWCKHAILSGLLLESQETLSLDAQFKDLLVVTSRRCPGLLREIAQLYALIADRGSVAQRHLQEITSAVPAIVEI